MILNCTALEKSSKIPVPPQFLMVLNADTKDDTVFVREAIGAIYVLLNHIQCTSFNRMVTEYLHLKICIHCDMFHMCHLRSSNAYCTFYISWCDRLVIFCTNALASYRKVSHAGKLIEQNSKEPNTETPTIQLPPKSVHMIMFTKCKKENLHLEYLVTPDFIAPGQSQKKKYHCSALV